MGWADLLSEPEELVLPWVGGRVLSSQKRFWRLEGKFPPEFGWYRFEVSGGRKAKLLGPAEPDLEQVPHLLKVKGYLVGDRLIPDTARVDPDPDKLILQTRPVALVEPGLDRFARATVGTVVTDDLDEPVLIYLQQEFPQGPEGDVEMAYQDRKDSVVDVAGVTPALDLAFRWLSWLRLDQEARERAEALRRAEEEKQRIAEERLREAMKDAGTGAGRRALARVDFNAAARAALGISGAELLDARAGGARGEMVVQYRFRHRRLECTVNRETMRVIDSGCCFTDHHGTKGDTFFTLESLPAVVAEAMAIGRLVVYRHAPGDNPHGDHQYLDRNRVAAHEDDDDVDEYD